MFNIQPLGGVGQIGSNMTLFYNDETSFLIDCGILFPNEDFFDINYLIPDMEKIEKTPSDIIISHGHEDHIGAIVHLVKRFPQIKIHAPLFARELILKKFEYAKISHPILLYKNDTRIVVDKFCIDPIHVNHSIPDTFGLHISLNQTDNNDLSVFFVSDFKIDKHTPHEKPFDFKKLIELSKDCNTKVLLADSTNITSSSLETPSEKHVFEGLSNVISTDDKRIFITTFSSNIHRLQSIINIAAKIKYKVVPYGRSMKNYIQIALENDHLQDISGCLKDSKSCNDKDTNHIILLSGCQGDFRGSLKRVATGLDPIFKVKKEDVFIFSSKPIPGNEKKIYNIINDLSVVGSEVIYTNESLIHASGHPGKLDLLELYNSYKPTNIVPIHGEQLFLKKHVEYIEESFPSAIAHLMTNYDIFNINSLGKAKIKKPKHSFDPILIHGNGIEIQKRAISQRRKIACNGIIFISIKIDSLTKLKMKFDYTLQGLPDLTDEQLDSFTSFLISEISNRKITALDKTSEDLRVSLRRFFNNILGYKPITIIHFV